MFSVDQWSLYHESHRRCDKASGTLTVLQARRRGCIETKRAPDAIPSHAACQPWLSLQLATLILAPLHPYQACAEGLTAFGN